MNIFGKKTSPSAIRPKPVTDDYETQVNGHEFLDTSLSVKHAQEQGKTPNQIKGLQHREKINIMDFIQAMKILTPILNSVSQLSLAEKAKEIRQRIMDGNLLAVHAVSQLGYNPNQTEHQWMVNQFEVLFAQHQGLSKEDVELLIKMSESISVAKTDHIEDVNAQIMLSYNRAITSALLLYQAVPLGIEQNAFITQFTDQLQTICRKIFQARVDHDISYLTPKDKAIFYSAIIRQFSSCFSIAWDLEVQKFAKSMEEQYGNNLNNWRRENPQGQDLTELYQLIDNTLTQSFNLASKLVEK